MKRIIISVLAVPLGGLITASAMAENAAPTVAAPDGEHLFRQHCAACHAEEGWASRVLARRVPEGQGPLEAREILPAALVKVVVRQGIGSMPAIRRTELDDADLSAIATYLETRE